jgi:hypothetical protein
MMVILLVVNVIILACFYIGFLFLQDESEKIKRSLKEVKKAKAKLRELERRLEEMENE